MPVDISGINGWAVLAAAVASYALGAIWYAPPVFGRRRLAALGKTREELGSPVRPMAVQAFLSLVVAWVLAAVVVRFGAVTWIEGAAIGLVLSVGLVAASLLTDWMFCGYSMKLYWIQAGHKVLQFTVQGVILGAWR
jgi:hypothetical protein